MKLWFMLLSIAAILITAPAHAKAPMFESELWPMEGSENGPLGDAGIELQTRPFEKAESTTQCYLSSNTPVEVLGSLTRTMQPGVVKITASATLISEGNYGPIDHLSIGSAKKASGKIALNAGQVIEELQPLAESDCIVRINRDVVAAYCPWMPGNTTVPIEFQVVSEPNNETWVKVSGPDGKCTGWAALESLERAFIRSSESNKDSGSDLDDQIRKSRANPF